MFFIGEKVAKLTGTPLRDDWIARGKTEYEVSINVEMFNTYVEMADMELSTSNAYCPLII